MIKINAISIVLSLSISKAHSQAPMEKLADQVCVCFSKANVSIDDFMSTKIDGCLNELPKGVREELMVSLGIDTTTMAEADAYKFGYEIGRNVLPIMIRRCDSFFNAFDEFKSNFFGAIDEKKEAENVKNISKLIKVDPSLENYFNRALSYYKLKNSKKALKDIEWILNEGKSTQGYVLRAFVYDQMGEYRKAILDYQKSKELTQKIEFDFFIAIAERKLQKN